MGINSSYRDKTGKGFFLPIYPKFETNRGKYGGRLGIHPDGNKRGTLGCIGILNEDTSNFYNAIASTHANINLILKVQ